VQPYDFANPAPDAVAPDCGSQGLFDAPTESADVLAIGADENGELAARPPAPFAIDRIVIFAVNQAAGARKIKRGSLRLA
jgi:hypothetical protein